MIDKHTEAQELYARYLVRSVELGGLRQYARSVADATNGAGMTPVKPLATMGHNGGPLLCDICNKPMILEGGGFQGVYADEGWRRNPKEGWVSYISEGMVVRIEVNGTLRIYHGYPGRSGCVLKADAHDDEAREKFADGAEARDASGKLELLKSFLEDEHPQLANDKHLTEIYKVLFKYDPGDGVNHP